MHQELRRTVEVHRADPVRQVKQAPEPTVHARHAKLASIVRRQRLMLRLVQTVQRVSINRPRAVPIASHAFRKLVAVVFVDLIGWWCLLIGGDGQWLFFFNTLLWHFFFTFLLFVWLVQRPVPR